MNAAQFLINVLFDLYLMVVLLRLWLQLAKADFYNPFSQFVVKATHPIVGPMRRLIPSLGSFDTATFILAFLVAALKLTTLAMLAGNVYPVTILAIASLATVITEAFRLIFYVLILRAILSWVSQGYNPIEMLMQQLTEPFLAPIRKVIPPIGGLDLSILFALIALQVIQILIADTFGIY